MSLADISIKNPVFAWMLNGFLIVFGAISVFRLGVSQMPDIDFPNVSISVSLEGASPEIMETDVVDPIEDSMMTVQGIKEITSSCKQGRANINLLFDLDRDIDAAVQDVQSKLLQVQRILPKEVDPPVVTKTNPEDQPIMWVGVSGIIPQRELMQYARFGLKDRIQTVPGVGEVMLGGYVDRNVRVWLKPDELEARGLTVDDVVAALQREHIEIPAGRIETPDREMTVRSMGEAPTVKELKRIVIAMRSDSSITLDQVAVIEDGMEDARRLARVNGLPAVGMGIKKQRGANAVEVANAVRARIQEIIANKENPDGTQIGINFDSTKFIKDSIGEMGFTLALSVALTSLVCWLFLGSLSSTFNILLAIPTSIVGSFILIYFLGFTLNMFTLMALSLAIGIVVDDAIMVLENITRHREKGESRLSAASRGAREITFAAIAASFALMAIFLPIAFMSGLIGKFLYQFGVTISVAVALSLLEALTLTPMRCSQMIESGERSTAFGRFLDRLFKGLAAKYRAILEFCLAHRWKVVAASLLFFTGSLYVIKFLNVELVPFQDQSMYLVRIQCPPGSALDYTDDRVKRCEKIVSDRPEIVRYFGAIGGFGGGDVDTAMMFVTLKPPDQRGEKPISQLESQNVIRQKFNSIPGVKANVMDLSMRGMSGHGTLYPVQFVITGPNLDTLEEVSERFMAKMRDSGLMVDVMSDYIVGIPEVRVTPDRDRAARLGVSVSSIGTTINAMIGGIRASKFTDAGHRFDIRVRLLSDARSKPEDIDKLFVRNRDGKLVRLSDVVDWDEKPSLQSINRRNRSRAITVSAGIVTGKSQKEALDRVQQIANDKEVLPSGYAIEFTGSSQTFKEAGLGLIFALVMGAVIAYMILASQFNSFVHGMLVLIAMPFSLTGAVIAMLITGTSLNMYSMIGIILLMGIVKKNSILLVDFTNQQRRQGKPVDEALLIACPIRLRPILMTSCSTIAGALPAAFTVGPGAETRMPMAIVVIGGLVLSTFLTLIVVPCALRILPGRVDRIDIENGKDVTPGKSQVG